MWYFYLTYLRNVIIFTTKHLSAKPQMDGHGETIKMPCSVRNPKIRWLEAEIIRGYAFQQSINYYVKVLSSPK